MIITNFVLEVLKESFKILDIEFIPQVMFGCSLNCLNYPYSQNSLFGQNSNNLFQIHVYSVKI